ncbi:GNAT family N-acetyltransferase [Alkalihalobacillus pseudalcaliphilus]|uniref:GNAT family N-acetyltransferase n=1 Tax=Alkalihalobacillus pseudalcaliphilus TaxID=79884 RepID=UPI00064DDC18|nr:GNAT family N-acetyltransferase [Alkalihalobacillus pseudalcaliphilus]KMK76826.1 acetyltransferase [Alkalihalobacillus pseudalcaliphilus]
MEIREARVQDAERFLELTKSVDKSGYMLYEPGEKTMTVDQQKALIERISHDQTSTFLVAETSNTLIGFIGAFGGSLKRNRHSAYLVIGVDESYRGQGVGTKLFEHIFRWAKSAAITRLELTVMTSNTAAFLLYQKVGFTIEGEKVHSLMIDGQPMNEYYLYKLIV